MMMEKLKFKSKMPLILPIKIKRRKSRNMLDGKKQPKGQKNLISNENFKLSGGWKAGDESSLLDMMEF
jgi:hypothetical protein